MLRPELYHKTVDILVQAYFNDTLESWNCSACAVGNLVAANMGYELKKPANGGLRWYNQVGELIHSSWSLVHSLSSFGQEIRPMNYGGKAKAEIDSTGYSYTETASIELAFENGYEVGEADDERMFNGLMAVIEVLDQIHENTDTDVTTASKQKFQRA